MLIDPLDGCGGGGSKGAAWRQAASSNKAVCREGVNAGQTCRTNGGRSVASRRVVNGDPSGSGISACGEERRKAWRTLSMGLFSFSIAAFALRAAAAEPGSC